MRSLVIDLGAQVIPIDGKTVKGSYDRNGEQSALYKSRINSASK
ncbi:MAG: hypothetical protein QNJ55_11335 [Xenococcus sp. MO_188.B8]|nr:hypothetical protein [Xenococcus sp. MO_188.B8]